jgi:hypothetical protein
MEDKPMKLARTIIKAAGLIVMASGLAVAQQNDLTAQLSKMLDANAKGYLEPLASGLGAGLNSGFYHSADLHSILGFDIGVKVGMAMIKDENKTFNFVLPATIKVGAATFVGGTDYDMNVADAPTFAGGAGKDVKVKSGRSLAGTTIFTTPQGYDYSQLPLFAPQAAIGLPFGIEVIGRFLPSTNLGNAGKVNFVGFGLRHDIDQYIPFCPVDIAIHFMTQKVTVNDKSDKKVMSLSGTAFGAEVSKSLILFTVYGGFQFESSSLSLEKYNYTDPTTGLTAQVNGFSIDGANKTRFLAGIRLLLAVINIHADYSFSKYPVATAGVGITFR